MAQFQLENIFRDAFGYEAPTTKFTIPQASARKEISKLGQPFWFTDTLGREFFLPVTINGMDIPFAVLGMTWKKTIVSTAMPERGGSVNELISIDDYTFNLKGILVDEEGNFPDGGIMSLHDMFQINASVVMRSVLSDIVLTGKSNNKKDDPFGHRVIIKEMKWPATSGVEHAKPFEMDLVSDMIFDLEMD